jgi:ribosomal protein L37E
MKKKKKNNNKIVRYFCRKCGEIYEIDIEEDEFTIKVKCSRCHIKMYKIKKDG